MEKSKNTGKLTHYKNANDAMTKRQRMMSKLPMSQRFRAGLRAAIRDMRNAKREASKR